MAPLANAILATQGINVNKTTLFLPESVGVQLIPRVPLSAYAGDLSSPILAASNSVSTWLAVGSGLGAFVFLLSACCLLWFLLAYRRRKKRRKVAPEKIVAAEEDGVALSSPADTKSLSLLEESLMCAFREIEMEETGAQKLRLVAPNPPLEQAERLAGDVNAYLEPTSELDDNENVFHLSAVQEEEGSGGSSFSGPGLNILQRSLALKDRLHQPNESHQFLPAAIKDLSGKRVPWASKNRALDEAATNRNRRLNEIEKRHAQARKLKEFEELSKKPLMQKLLLVKPANRIWWSGPHVSNPVTLNTKKWVPLVKEVEEFKEKGQAWPPPPPVAQLIGLSKTVVNDDGTTTTLHSDVTPLSKPPRPSPLRTASKKLVSLSKGIERERNDTTPPAPDHPPHHFDASFAEAVRNAHEASISAARANAAAIQRFEDLVEIVNGAGGRNPEPHMDDPSPSL